MKHSSMRRPIRLVSALVLAAAFSVPLPAASTGIDPGFDLFATPAGTVVLDFGFGPIAFIGKPIPGLGNTDTIIQRKDPISIFPNTIETEIVALSLVSASPIVITDPFSGASSFFDVFLTINALGLPGLHPLGGLLSSLPSLGHMTVDHSAANGGMFVDSFFDVFVELDIPGLTSPQLIPDQLTNGGGSWSHTPPPGYPSDPRLPSGGFYAGPTHHTGPHPQTVPAVPEPGTWMTLVAALAGIAAAGLRRKKA